MDDLIDFLNSQDDFFIEVEGRIADIRKELGNHLNSSDEGVCALANNSNKWTLEYRLYTHERPKPLLGNKFHSNTNIRHRGYEYRLSDNNLIKGLLIIGYHLGKN